MNGISKLGIWIGFAIRTNFSVFLTSSTLRIINACTTHNSVLTNIAHYMILHKVLATINTQYLPSTSTRKVRSSKSASWPNSGFLSFSFSRRFQVCIRFSIALCNTHMTKVGIGNIVCRNAQYTDTRYALALALACTHIRI